MWGSLNILSIYNGWINMTAILGNRSTCKNCKLRK